MVAHSNWLQPQALLGQIRLQVETGVRGHMRWALFANDRLHQLEAELQELRALRATQPLVLIGNKLKLGSEPGKIISWKQAVVIRKMIKEGKGCASLRQLRDWTGIDEPHKEVAKLAKKYPQHVFAPGGGYKGGYRTTIILAD